ncbi:hypothetical protein BGY98DRAFT_342662 [Russula aff. rugulosa BPL654]|nr:hypothetical protein BGY98DRAFT_342662 [Russula aff. rugulosa BPL654]
MNYNSSKLRRKLRALSFFCFPALSFPWRKYATFMRPLSRPLSRRSTIHTLLIPWNTRLTLSRRRICKVRPTYCTGGTLQENVYNKEELLSVASVQTDEVFISFVKEYLESAFRESADSGVVDNKLKVFGTTKIRIIDISIILGRHVLITPIGYIETAYAIGELGADIIRGRCF